MRSIPSKKSNRPLWHFLLPPMLLLSLGLHGLVLFAPVSPSEDELVPPPDPEEDGIAITKIDPPQPRPVTPPPNTGTVKTSAPTQNAAAQSTAKTQGNPATGTQSRNSSLRSGRGNSNQGRSARQNTRASNTQVNVPNLAPGQPAQNPNPNAPSVNSANSSNPQITAGRIDPFEAYFSVFGTYSGVKPLSEEEAKGLQINWINNFKEQGTTYANVEIEPLQDLAKLPYEAKICLPATPTPAQILVMVEADGTLDEDKQFVQRTGYRSFDQAALAALNSYQFPRAETPKAYLAEVEVAYDPEDCDWPPEVDNLPDEYFTVLQSYVGPDLTTLSDFSTAKAAWVQKLGASADFQVPDQESFEPTAFEGFEPQVEYPLALCLPIEPKDARWGVVVNPDGSLQGEPELLRSTGYRNFNDRSQELIKAFDFPTSDQIQVYVVEVKVNYNGANCQRPDSNELRTNPTTASAASSTTNNPRREAPTTQSNAPTVAFEPTTQAQLAEQGRKNVLGDPKGELNNNAGLLVASLERSWPTEIDRSCFLSRLDEEAGLVPAEKAKDALVLTENIESVPATLSRLYQVESEDSGTYCEAPLYLLRVNGIPQLFASIVGFGVGNASALVVIWPVDPREI